MTLGYVIIFCVSMICVTFCLYRYFMILQNYRLLEKDIKNLEERNAEQKDYYEEKLHTKTSEIEILKNTIKKNAESYSTILSNDIEKSISKLIATNNQELKDGILKSYQTENSQFFDHNQKILSQMQQIFREDITKMVNRLSFVEKKNSSFEETITIVNKALISPSFNANLSEISLENLLQSIGLKKNQDFFMQLNIGNTQLRPDCVILLPNGSAIIIDCKTSSSIYEHENENRMSKFQKALKKHLKSLISKDYKEHLLRSLSSNISQDIQEAFLVMLLPSDSVVSELYEYDSQLFEEGIKNSIILSSNSGILNILLIANSHIAEYKRSKSSNDIILELHELLNHISEFGYEMNGANKHFRNFVRKYYNATHIFNTKILYSSQNIIEYGIQPKTMPTSIQNVTEGE